MNKLGTSSSIGSYLKRTGTEPYRIYNTFKSEFTKDATEEYR
jgi:hypothetical protein